MDELRKRFVTETGIRGWELCVVAVQLPNGAVEVITNTQELDSKIEYYLNAYDDQFRLKANPEVRIVGYMLV